MDESGTPNRFMNRPASTPIRFLTDVRLDFGSPVSLRKSYVIASSDRYSSAFACKSLWQTGRLGAPWEYLSASVEDERGTLAAPANRSVASTMMKRLKAGSPSEYIAQLLACRTSRNGVFGFKARFDDFKSAIEQQVPELLSTLEPVSYIYIDSHDKLAQAVAAVKALSADSGAIALEGTSVTAPLTYDRDLISKYLGKLERQRLDWWRWFEANGIEPFVLYRENVIANIAGEISAVEKLLDVNKDDADVVNLPTFAQEPKDATADEYAAQFARETENGIDVERASFLSDDLFGSLGFSPTTQRTCMKEWIPPFFVSRAKITRSGNPTLPIRTRELVFAFNPHLQCRHMGPSLMSTICRGTNRSLVKIARCCTMRACWT